METMKWITWAVVLFFALSWTFGVIRHQQFRLKATVVSMVFWWIEIFIAMAGGFVVFHLLWLMPVSLIVPMQVGNADQLKAPPGSVARIFFKSLLFLSVPIAGLLWWGKT